MKKISKKISLFTISLIFPPIIIAAIDSHIKTTGVGKYWTPFAIFFFFSISGLIHFFVFKKYYRLNMKSDIFQTCGWLGMKLIGTTIGLTIGGIIGMIAFGFLMMKPT